MHGGKDRRLRPLHRHPLLSLHQPVAPCRAANSIWLCRTWSNPRSITSLETVARPKPSPSRFSGD